MITEYYYYIIRNPYDTETHKTSVIPRVFKVIKDKFPFHFKLINKNEAEGPYNSLYELKVKSFIFSTIKLQKHRERILKNSNIKELNDFIIHEKGFTYEESFGDALDHTIVGKISNRKVKGVHFYNPENIKILEVISIDRITGVYAARIAKLNNNTGNWIEKDEITNFFPDNWSINQLFHECYFAYSNKKLITNNLYQSRSISGILINFFINDEGKILTFFPEINNQ